LWTSRTPGITSGYRICGINAQTPPVEELEAAANHEIGLGCKVVPGWQAVPGTGCISSIKGESPFIAMNAWPDPNSAPEVFPQRVLRHSSAELAMKYED
jgi:hypothetical protein